MKRGTWHNDFRSAEMEPVRYWGAPVDKELPAAAAANHYFCLDHECCWWKTLLPSSLINMEFTGSSQKPESSQANGPLVCKRGKVTFLWVKLAGKVMQSCMWGKWYLFRSCAGHSRFSSVNPVTWERSLAKELILDVTRWQLFLEASQIHHYQKREVLFWQRNSLCVQWLSAQGNYHATL